MPDKDSQPDKKEENSPFEDQREETKKGVRDFGRRVMQSAPVQKTAKTFIQWMPMGGGMWFFGSFVVKQDWVNAIVAFPVLIVTVIWGAYTESVLKRLQEIFEEQGKKDVDRAMEWLGWQLAGTEEKYLRCQKSACRDYTTEGHKPALSIFIPLLDEVFVPLELSNRFLRNLEGDCLPMPASLKWDREVIERIKRAEGLRIWDLLKKVREVPSYRRMAILAWGGYGKTTLLRHVTYLYSYKKQPRNVPKLLPVLFYLRSQQERMVEGKLDLPELIEKHHIPSLPQGKDLNLPPNWVRKLLREGKMLVMFDGFDEVKEQWQQPVSLWIGKQMREYPKTVFILTSRPAGYKNFIAEDRFGTEVFVKSFNDDQKERFIRRWYLCQERYARGGRNTPEVKQAANENALNLLAQIHAGERSELKELAKNPLMLNMIVSLHRCYSGEYLPQQRVELYREIIRLQLGDRPLAKNIDMILSANQSQQVLQSLALDMLKENYVGVSQEWLQQCLKKHLALIDDSIETSEFLRKVEEVSELLVKQDENYVFSHVSFRNYLAAVEIREKQQEELLRQNWDNWDHNDEGWYETFWLYALQIHPKSLLKFISQVNTEDIILTAYEISDTMPLKSASKLEKELIILHYEKLKKLLKNRDWGSANRTTGNLINRLTKTNLGEGLSIENIHNLPDNSLRVINQLWVDHSQNHFGFSVQYKIFSDLSDRIKDKEFDLFTLYKKFCNCVNWNVEDENDPYPKQSNINFPKGHFPKFMNWMTWMTYNEKKMDIYWFTMMQKSRDTIL